MSFDSNAIDRRRWLMATTAAAAAATASVLPGTSWANPAPPAEPVSERFEPTHGTAKPLEPRRSNSEEQPIYDEVRRLVR